MKRTIVRYTLAIIGLFSVTSCTDYLDNAPDDILTLEMVFNSKNRTEEWLAGIYDGIPDPYTPMMRNYDAYADDFSPSQDWRAFSDWDCIDKILGNWTPQSEWKGNFWSDFPVRIREAYIFLDNVKALPEQEVYQADVDNMKAEAEEWRNKLIEEVAATDDALMEKFFEDPASITPEELIAAIRKATIQMTLVPMLCGSSFHNKGVQKLLDCIIAFLPSPLDLPAVTGINPKTDEEVVRHASEDDPFCGLAFKIATDPFVGRLAFVRVYSGKLDAGSYVLDTRSGKRERISRIYQMHSNKQNPIETVVAGDICAAVGFKEIRTGDTLCAENAPIVLEQMTFPEPVIGLAVEPKTQKDLDKLGIALGKLAEEDPTFTVRTDEESGQTIISGMGELHLDIIVDRLRREFGVEINQGAPQVNYKEALTTTVQHREVFKKQTGGRGKFADIIFEIGPAEEGKMGLTFVDEVKGGNIPKEFIPSVQKGFEAAMAAIKTAIDNGTVTVATPGIVYCGAQGGDQGTRALVNNLYSDYYVTEDGTSYNANSANNVKALTLLQNMVNAGSLSANASYAAADELTEGGEGEKQDGDQKVLHGVFSFLRLTGFCSFLSTVSHKTGKKSTTIKLRRSIPTQLCFYMWLIRPRFPQGWGPLPSPARGLPHARRAPWR